MALILALRETPFVASATLAGFDCRAELMLVWASATIADFDCHTQLKPVSASVALRADFSFEY